MKRLFVLAGIAAVLFLSHGTVRAESIKGTLGVTAKIGFVNPSDSELGDFRVKPDVGIIGGGGFLYGIDDKWAAEFDLTASGFGSDFPRSGNAGDFGVTNVSLGGQYRFSATNPQFVPYIGAGLDVLITDYRDFDLDTTVGVHVSGGVDYFLYKKLALNAEIKAVLAPEADISNAAGRQGKFDPSSFSSTFGVRYFFF